MGMTEPLPLNFGDAGHRPLTFKVPEKENIDVGFIRIFISTRYTDLSSVAQRPAVRRGLNIGVGYGCRWTKQPEVWDAITIPVVMK